MSKTMAAPPIPPKGSSNSWIKDNEVADHAQYGRISPNTFSVRESNSHVYFNSQFSSVHFDRTLEDAPPLPPRCVNQEKFPKLPREVNQLFVVPPPPFGQSFKQDQKSFIELSCNSNSEGNLPVNTFFNSANANFPADVNLRTMSQLQNITLRSHSDYRVTNSSKANPSVLLNNSVSRSFSNNVYNASVVPYACQGYSLQHSRSGPNLTNNPQSIVVKGHRSSLPNMQNIGVNNINTPLNNNNALTTSNSTNVDNVLKFMKKKRDSNLIDLYCKEDETYSKPVSSLNLDTNDILKMFDPLTQVPEEESDILPDEAVDSPIQSTDEIIERTSNHIDNKDDDSSSNTEIKKTEDVIYSKIVFNSKFSNPVLKILPVSFSTNTEIFKFCEKLKKLRSEFLYDDYLTNTGIVLSASLDNYQEDSLSIQLIINSNHSKKPVSFTCDVNTSIEHIISHTVCSVFDDTTSLSMDDFVLQVHGLSEYFTAHSTLADYEYVHQCHKFDKPVCLTLVDIKDLVRPLARTKLDDYNDTNFKMKDISPSQSKASITYENLNILLDTLEREMEKIKSSALKFESAECLHAQGVEQAVKAICTLLSHVETSEINHSINDLKRVCSLYGKPNDVRDFDTLPELGAFKNFNSHTGNSDKNRLQNLFQLLESALQSLQQAVYQLLLMCSKSFNVNFELPNTPLEASKFVTDFLDTLLFQLCIVHHLPIAISSQYDSFNIMCELFHGKNVLSSVTSRTVNLSKRMFRCFLFEEWLQFETILMCTLPREAILYFTLWGMKTVQTDSKNDVNQNVKTSLGWCGIRLFTYKEELIQGNFLLGFWPSDIPKHSGPVLCNPNISSTLLQIKFPEFEYVINFPPVIDNKFASSQKRDFDCLEPQIQTALLEIIDRDLVAPLKAEERELLWEKRHYLYEYPQALPKVLLSAHGWDWACLSDIYILLKMWKPLSPVDSLQLLLPHFPDKEVRQTAVNWMKDIVSDELCDYLAQIIQVLRYEAWDDSPVAWFLLERSLTSIRVSHHMYWFLKQSTSDPVVSHRMQLMLNSVLIIAGKAVRNRFETQENLLSNLSDIAEKIKTTKESLRLNTLFHELEVTHHNLVENPTCLPLSPSLEVCGVDVKSCSYFTSNTLPLKLLFCPPEKGAKNKEAIYKVGDDLRQDMLTLQMIRIMDKLWLKEGLDLKIVTFMCIATEYKKGMVELVPEAETLRKIQSELGLVGSFKDRPIAEWLQKYNTSELEYQQAVENFTLSCAGYCVATYILGICDRHNDNIMLKTSGHIFHIDFGKFLGDSQMFGSIKRDRTPFVLTSDMAYVINGGDKPSKGFQYFIDLCCQAFNIVRKHSSIFLNLFTLMVDSGITGVSHNAVNYIQKALLPGKSEVEAAGQFTHMIQESLKSWFTQFNFFIHNLAQLRFTGDHNEDLLLSFIPKVFTKESDGKIFSAVVIGYQKMYDPEKYYTYVIKVEKQSQPDPMYIFRTYREFVEFHQKLTIMFPLAKFHPLPGNPLMGRTNVREVADRRKSELNVFLRSLMSMAEEISHCSLVYTFFHPLLRDQEGISQEREMRVAMMKSRRSSSVGQINGQIKLSIIYKNNSLFVMVMHAKNLNSSKGTAPDPYVKTYLLPDPNKVTKRKTKTVMKNCHPTFMEMLVYELPLEVICCKSLHVSVWDYDRVQENEFLGAILIPLSAADLQKEEVKWYQLGNFNN